MEGTRISSEKDYETSVKLIKEGMEVAGGWRVGF